MIIISVAVTVDVPLLVMPFLTIMVALKGAVACARVATSCLAIDGINLLRLAFGSGIIG